MLAQKKKVVVKLNYYQPYCGGARPNQAMQEEAQKPKPYANYMVYIKSEKGRVDSVKTNADGELKVKLKPGNYKVFEKWRFYKLSPGGEALSNYSTDCLNAEWAKESYTINITKKSYTITETNTIVFNCAWNQPCLKEDKKFMPE